MFSTRQLWYNVHWNLEEFKGSFYIQNENERQGEKERVREIEGEREREKEK